MKKLILFFGLLTITLLSSCEETLTGVGNPQPETRSVSPFSDIVTDGSINITFRQIKDGVDKVVVTAQENLLPIIVTKVEDDVLKIYTECAYETDQKMSIEIYGRSLNSLNMNGSGDFNARLKVNTIELKSSGSGDISLEGTTDYLEAALNGSGDLSAIELRTFNCELEMNGSGDAKIYAKESLEVELNGSGDVSYKGRAKVEKTINGSGEVFEL